jgi:hypothetical protein
MSLTYGFYNSLNGDRKYDAVQMSSIFDGIINDGVFATIGSAMKVTADSGLTVKVGTGRAWFNHTWTLNDAIFPITVEESELLLDRIDAVVLEINSNEDVRANSLKIVKGVPASSPANPGMANDDVVHQYPLCYIYRKAASTEITQADITNVVGTTECPFVTGPLATVTTDDLLLQWKAEFDAWFEGLKTNLSEDVAGNLTTILVEHMNDTNNPHQVTPELIGAAPAYSCGTTDLTPGSSSLKTGKLYFVYE